MGSSEYRIDHKLQNMRTELGGLKIIRRDFDQYHSRLQSSLDTIQARMNRLLDDKAKIDAGRIEQLEAEIPLVEEALSKVQFDPKIERLKRLRAELMSETGAGSLEEASEKIDELVRAFME